MVTRLLRGGFGALAPGSSSARAAGSGGPAIASIVANSSSGRSGLETYRPCPRPGTLRDRRPSRCAVSARIGVWRPVPCSCSRIAAVASSPLISGICTSIRMMSNVSLRRALHRLPPVATIDTRVRAARAAPRRASGSSRCPRRPARAAARRGSLRPARPFVARGAGDCGTGPANAVTIASSRSDCLTGLASSRAKRRRRRAARRRRRPPTSAESPSAPSADRRARSVRASLKPSMPGISASVSTR